jgi:hypothetical protein
MKKTYGLASELSGSDFLTPEKSAELLGEAQKALKQQNSSLVFIRCNNLITNALKSDPTHCKDVLDFKDFVFDFSFNSYDIDTKNNCVLGSPGCRIHQVINMRPGTGNGGPLFISKEALTDTTLLYTRGVFKPSRPLGLDHLLADFFPVVLPTQKIPASIGSEIGAALQKPSLQIQNVVHLSNAWRDENLGKRRVMAIGTAALMGAMAGGTVSGGFLLGATAKSILPAVLAKQPLSALVALGSVAEIPGNIAGIIVTLGNIRNRVNGFKPGGAERIAAQSTIFIADSCKVLSFSKMGAQTVKTLSTKVAVNLLLLSGGTAAGIANSPAKAELEKAILHGDRKKMLSILENVSQRGLNSSSQSNTQATSSAQQCKKFIPKNNSIPTYSGFETTASNYRQDVGQKIPSVAGTYVYLTPVAGSAKPPRFLVTVVGKGLQLDQQKVWVNESDILCVDPLPTDPNQQQFRQGP